MEKKLRYSHHREMIYNYLLASHDHPSAEMVHNDLKSRIQGLSLGTVYRNLKLLEELGKVRRVASFQGSERYDAYCNDHVHFLCGRCGSLRDIENADHETIRSAIALGDGYRLSKLDLTVTGVCPKCTG